MTLAIKNQAIGKQQAVLMAPKKQAATAQSEAAVKADELFWQTF
jgi:hypothetical protein